MNLKGSCCAILLILNISVSLQANHFYVKSAEDEQRLISQLYNYMNIIIAQKLGDTIKVAQKSAKELLYKLPMDKLENMPEILQENMLNSEQQPNSMQAKKRLLADMEHLLENIAKALQKTNPGDEIFNALSKISAEIANVEFKFTEKILKVATLFPRNFPVHAIERNQKLFDLLKEICEQLDIERRDELLENFQQMEFN